MTKIKLTAICVLFVLISFVAKSQISTDELPISFSFKEEMVKTNSELLKTMPPIDLEKLQTEDEIDEKLGIPPRFGYPHEVNFNLENSGEWFNLPNGDRIWQLEISCPKALSINLLYDKFWLPEGAKFFIYSSDKKHIIGAFTSTNNFGNQKDLQGFATGLVYGDKIILEYYLPKEVSSQGIISIANVVQGYRYINIDDFNDVKKNENSFQDFNNSGQCQVNINCSPEGDNWQNEKNAVALIIVDGTRMCTGALINNTNNDNYRYFLTADHCLVNKQGQKIYDAINNPNLTNWSFLWHYESPNCNRNINGPIISTSGATVIANNAASDFALLRLTEDPKNKNGVTPYYLGWDRTGNAGTGGVGIHHPSGDIKKIATYNITPPNTSNCMTVPGNFWKINWMSTTNGHSVTEGGSSGSPLINSNHKIIGQLYGSGIYCVASNNPNCSNPKNDIANYGKFSVSWNNSTDSRRRLSNWLDPNNTGTTILNGINYCNSITLTNIQTTQRVECKEIILENATVPSGVKLELQATESVIINPGTVIESGSSFIIW